MGKFVNVVVSQENLRFNLEKIKLCSKNKKICVMVKANSYGHGIKEVVSALKGRADFFGVINLEEAFKVRCEDSFTPIICFAPIEEHDFLFASKMNVSLSISSLQYFFNILKFVNKTACKIKIHININTGMNRLGIKTVKQFKEMQDECENNKNIIVEGVYTHFAAAECDAKFSERQIKTFNKFLFHLSKRFSGIIHVGGSAAMMLKYDNLIEDIDMFRVGINIYGYNAPKEIFLKKCLKVFSSVLSVFNVSKGERVGYSNGFIANHNIKVACIMLGYADGFSRLLKNNYTVYINKIKCPLIGNLCMDMMMIDVSNVKNVKEGDKVLVFYDAAKVGKITKEGVYQALVSLNNIRK